MSWPWIARGQAAQAFGGINLVPTSFLIDAEGRIVERKLGEIDKNEMAEKIGKLLKKDA